MKIEYGAPGRCNITIEQGDDFNLLDKDGRYFGMVRYLNGAPIIYLSADFKVEGFSGGSNAYVASGGEASQKGEPDMNMQPVSSSNIAAVGYDEEKKLLRVHFKNGGRYDYSDVSREEYDGLLGAESIGRHLNTHIKSKSCSKCE